jgi:hypothetical protein
MLASEVSIFSFNDQNDVDEFFEIFWFTNGAADE